LEELFDVEGLIDALIDREGGYVNHSADKGGPTCFGITEAVARAHGYRGAMRELPRDEARKSIAGSTGCGLASAKSRNGASDWRRSCSTPA
jgi:hypothetical protein